MFVTTCLSSIAMCVEIDVEIAVLNTVTQLKSAGLLL